MTKREKQASDGEGTFTQLPLIVLALMGPLYIVCIREYEVPNGPALMGKKGSGSMWLPRRIMLLMDVVPDLVAATHEFSHFSRWCKEKGENGSSVWIKAGYCLGSIMASLNRPD